MRGILTIGGIDPTGGAGVTADVQHIHDAGLWACPIATAMTVQTTETFAPGQPVDAVTFTAALEAAQATVSIIGAKTGYFANAEQVEYCAAFLRSLRQSRPGLAIVVDPVGTATAPGAPERDAVLAAIRDKLVPIATVVTPNRGELSALLAADAADQAKTKPASSAVAGDVVSNDAAMGDVAFAAGQLVALGAQCVVVTGADVGPDDVTDLIVTRERRETIRLPRQAPDEVHGSGCAVAARLVAHLVHGMSPPLAARAAVLAFAGFRPTAHLSHAGATQALLAPAPLAGDSAHEAALGAVLPALLQILPPHWVAECGNNVAFVEPEGPAVALAERIRLRNGRPHATLAARHLHDGHVVRVARAASVVTETAACALNLRHVPDLFAAAQAAGLSVGRFDRREEPADAASSVEWGTRTVLERGVVDLVADGGAHGKEPMVRLIAHDPSGLLAKLERLVAARSV